MLSRLYHWHDWPLATKLALLLVALAVAPLTFVTLYNDASARAELLTATRAQNLQRAHGTAGVLDAYMEETLADIQLMAIAPDTVHFLQDPQDERGRAEVSLVLRQMRETYGFDALYVTDQSGNVLLATADRFLGRNYVAARWFRNAIAGQASFDEPRYDAEEAQIYLHFSGPVRSPEGMIVGAVIGRITLSPIDRIIAADTNFSGRGDFGVLWDDLGIRLSHGIRPDLRFKPYAPLSSDVASALIAEARFGPVTSDLLKGASQSPEVTDRSGLLLYDRSADPYLRFTSRAAGSPVYAAIVPLNSKRWLYGVQTPEAGILSTLNAQTQRALLIALGTGLLAILAAFVGARWSTHHIRAVAETANALAAGDMARRVGLKQRDEVGQLAAAFDVMADALVEKDARLHGYTAQLEQKVQEGTEALRASEAELRALFAAMTDVILVLDAQGRYLKIAPTNPALLYKPPAELIGRTLHEVFPVAQADAFLGYIHHALETHETVNTEYSLQIGDRETWFAVAISPVLEDTVIWVARDITKRRWREEEIRRRNEELAALNQIGQALGRLAKPSEILELIYTMIGRVLDNRNLYTALYDEANQQISFPVYTIDGQRREPTSRPFGNGLTEYVIRTKAPLLLPRNVEAALTERGIASIGHPARCFLAVPMLAGEKVIGVIAVQDYEKENVYNGVHAELLATFAAQAASAFENARLFVETERRADELAALYETTRDLATKWDVTALLQAIVERASALLASPGGAVYLYDAARRDLELVVGKGFPIPLGTHLQLGEGMAGRVAQTRQPLIVDDYRTWEHRSPKYEEVPFTAVLEVPMLFGGELIGVLSVHEVGSTTHKFTGEDARLLSLFAAQAASAVRTARLLTETERRANEFATLYDVSRDLATQRDLAPLLQTIVEQATTLLTAHGGEIYLYDSVRRDLELVVSKGPSIPLGTRLQPGEGMSGRVAETRKPLIVDNYHAWEHRSPQYDGIPYSAVVEVPMLYGGELIGVLSVGELAPTTRKFTDADVRLLSLFAAQAASAVHNARLFEETSVRAQQLGLLYDAGLTLNRVLDPRMQLEFLFKIAMKALHADGAEFFRHDAADSVLQFEVGVGHYEKAWDSSSSLDFSIRDERGLVGWVGKHRVPLNVPDVSADPRWVVIDPEIRSALWVPVEHESELRGVLGVLSTRVNAFTPQDERLLMLFANQVAVAMENARLFEETRRRAEHQAALYRVSIALGRVRGSQELCAAVVREVRDALGYSYLGVFLLDPKTGDRVLQAQSGWDAVPEDWRIHAGEGLSEKALLTGELQYWPDVTREPRYIPGLRGSHSELDVPIKIGDSVLGVLVVEDARVDAFGAEDFASLQAVANQLAVALENARLFAETRRRLEYLQVLRAMDQAIAASFDLRVTLNVLLEQVTTQLRLDAADILLLTPHTQTLEYAAGRGFSAAALQRTRLRLGEGHAGRAALERRIVSIPNLSEAAGDLVRTPLLASEGFVTYYGVPLVVKGQLKGVLEIFHRAPLDPDPEWLNFLETLAGQAAIAIDNSELFENLQRSNRELALAYDTTLEVWSRALDLRDREIEGHTQRVTEMTLKLARVVGVGGPELVHVRRGALLHDIGKMGIPDGILLKPGPLTDEEWAIMRKHPVYAYEMLMPSAYLRPALDIPYCHHEKWDGTGYPRGLKGEQIPLAARIFAVVDVWDALTSDRPYRPAWSKEQALEYIREQGGAHFDPRVVEAFLEMENQG